MAIFFTADTHFGHRNIIRFCNRPFKSLEEHDETLITNWNAVVSSNDEVYHLGDVGNRCSSKYLYRVLQRLNGRIYLIQGDHDKESVKSPCAERFEWINWVHFLTAQAKGETYEFWLAHYAHRSWKKSFHGSFHLFAHSHSRLPPYGLSFDAGVDCWGYTPISLVDTVVPKMRELKAALEANPSFRRD